MAKYRALNDGYLGTKKHAPSDRIGQVSKGEIFNWSGPKGKWMEEIKAASVAPEVVKTEAVTLSEIQKETPPPLSGEVVEAQEKHDAALETKKDKKHKRD